MAAGKEVIASYPSNCEGKAADGADTPLKDHPTPITVTLFSRKGDVYKREVGCGHLQEGRCAVSNDKPCVHLFPEASTADLSAKEKISAPAGTSVALDGGKVRALRIQAGLTQAQLARAARSGPTLIWKIETGDGTVKTKPQRADLIAAGLGVDLQVILPEPAGGALGSGTTTHRARSRRRVS